MRQHAGSTARERPGAGGPRRRLLRGTGRWAVRGVLLLAVVAFVFNLFGERVERTPENPGRADVATPYLQEVAAGLSQGRVFVDPVLVGTPAGDDVTSGRALADRPSDIRVAVVAVTSGDGNAGRLDLTGRRLQHLVGRDGLYVVVDQDGRCTGLRFDGETETQETCDEPFSAAELDRLVVETRPLERWYDPISAGFFALLAALGVCMLLGWLLRGLAWFRDRPSAYLPGLGTRARPAARRRRR